MQTNWICPKCSANNTPRRDRCRVCGYARGAAAPASRRHFLARLALPLALLFMAGVLTAAGVILLRRGAQPSMPPLQAQAATPSAVFEPTAPAGMPTLTPGPTLEPGALVFAPATDTGTDGYARLVFPGSGQQVTIQALDEDTRRPLQGISMTAVSDGRRLLVLAYDPVKDYLPQAQEYENVITAFPSAVHFASLRSTPALAILLTAVSFIKTQQDLLAIYNDGDNYFESWNFFFQDRCIGSDDLIKGKVKVLISDVGLIAAPFIPYKGFVGMPEDLTSQEYVTYSIGEWLVKDKAKSLLGDELIRWLEEYVMPEGVVRWRQFTLNGIGMPFQEIGGHAGWCLPPLDRKDPYSIVQWIDFGLSHPEMQEWVFSRLLADDSPRQSLIFGRYATEGSGTIPLAEARQELLRRTNAVCLSYAVRPDELLVFTQGWAPAWELGSIPAAEVLGMGFYPDHVTGEYYLDTLLPDPAGDDTTHSNYQPYLRGIIEKGLRCSELGSIIQEAPPKPSTGEEALRQVQAALAAGQPEMLQSLMHDQIFTGMSCCSDWVLEEQHWAGQAEILALLREDWERENSDQHIGPVQGLPTCLGYIPLQEKRNLRGLYTKDPYQSLTVYLSNMTSFEFTDGFFADGDLRMTEYWYNRDDMIPQGLLPCPQPGEDPQAETNVAEERAAILARAQYWADQQVPYGGLEQQGYSPSPAGYLHYAWDLPPAEEGGLDLVIQRAARTIFINELLPGDVLTDTFSAESENGRILIFDGWVDDASRQFYAYEIDRTPGYATRKVFTLEQLPRGGWTVAELRESAIGQFTALRLSRLP